MLGRAQAVPVVPGLDEAEKDNAAEPVLVRKGRLLVERVAKNGNIEAVAWIWAVLLFSGALVLQNGKGGVGAWWWGARGETRRKGLRDPAPEYDEAQAIAPVDNDMPRRRHKQRRRESERMLLSSAMETDTDKGSLVEAGGKASLAGSDDENKEDRLLLLAEGVGSGRKTESEQKKEWAEAEVLIEDITETEAPQQASLLASVLGAFSWQSPNTRQAIKPADGDVGKGDTENVFDVDQAAEPTTNGFRLSRVMPNVRFKDVLFFMSSMTMLDAAALGGGVTQTKDADKAAQMMDFEGNVFASDMVPATSITFKDENGTELQVPVIGGVDETNGKNWMHESLTGKEAMKALRAKDMEKFSAIVEKAELSGNVDFENSEGEEEEEEDKGEDDEKQSMEAGALPERAAAEEAGRPRKRTMHQHFTRGAVGLVSLAVNHGATGAISYAILQLASQNSGPWKMELISAEAGFPVEQEPDMFAGRNGSILLGKQRKQKTKKKEGNVETLDLATMEAREETWKTWGTLLRGLVQVSQSLHA